MLLPVSTDDNRFWMGFSPLPGRRLFLRVQWVRPGLLCWPERSVWPMHAMRESVDDHARYADSDVTFHLAVYAAAHNVLLSRFGVLVADFMRLSFGLQQAATPRSLNDDAEQHEAIVDAINRGDSAAAAAAMLHVVLDGKRALATVLGESQGDGR